MGGQRYQARIILRRAKRNTRGIVTGFEWETCEIEFMSHLRDAEIVGVESTAKPKVKFIKILDSSVDTLNLSHRARVCLVTANIRTIAELVQRQPYDLLKIKGAGETALKEYARAVEQYGLYLGMPLE